MLQQLAAVLVRFAILAVVLAGCVAIPPTPVRQSQPLVAVVLPQANPMSLQISNSKNRSWHYRWAARLNVITIPTPLLLSTLDITTDCGACKTVGIVVQFNVVKRSAGTVTSESDSSTQMNCTFGTCITMGLAVQYTVIVDNPARALPQIQRLMRRAVSLMRRMFPRHRVDVSRVLAGFNSLAHLLVPHAPRIVLTTPGSSRGTHSPSDPPGIVVALRA